MDREKCACDRHGEAYAILVCRHLLAGCGGEGFCVDDSDPDNPWPDAWCNDCQAHFQRHPDWHKEENACERFAVICHHCYLEIKARQASGDGPRPFNPAHFAKLNGPVTYTLDDGVELHKQWPETFHIPAAEERASLKPGAIAKLMFRLTDGTNTTVERMWVIVRESKSDGGYLGVLDNDPYCTQEIRSGMELEFGPEHVIAIHGL